MSPSTLHLILTPSGHLVFAPSGDTPVLPEDLQRRLEDSFGRTPGRGLLDLGLREVGTALPPVFAFWRDFAARYVTALCTSSQEVSDDDTAIASVAAPSRDDLDSLVGIAPPMGGGEYLSATVLESLWHQIDAACREERTDSKLSLQAF
jgi:hypothetical protein